MIIDVAEKRDIIKEVFTPLCIAVLNINMLLIFALIEQANLTNMSFTSL